VTLVTKTPKQSYESKQTAISDPVSEELQKRLLDKFVSKLQLELKDGNALAEIESLLGDLLEEVKVNYLNRSVDENIKKLNPVSD
jgi:hypothetical protein